MVLGPHSRSAKLLATKAKRLFAVDLSNLILKTLRGKVLVSCFSNKLKKFRQYPSRSSFSSK